MNKPDPLLNPASVDLNSRRDRIIVVDGRLALPAAAPSVSLHREGEPRSALGRHRARASSSSPPTERACRVYLHQTEPFFDPGRYRPVLPPAKLQESRRFQRHVWAYRCAPGLFDAATWNRAARRARA